MKQLTAIIHRGEPGANGQGETREACLSDLAAAVRRLVDTLGATKARLT